MKGYTAYRPGGKARAHSADTGPLPALAKLVASFSGSTATRDSYRPEMWDGFDRRRACSREDEKEHGFRKGPIADEPAMKALIIRPDLHDLTQDRRKASVR